MSTKFNGVVVEVSGVRTIEGGGTGSSGVGGVISINSSVDIIQTLTVQSSLSSPMVSSTFYGDGSNLLGIDRSFLSLSGGTVNGDVLLYGALTALSGATFINTTFIDTSALRITNSGYGPALYVEQGIGSGDIATFYDADGIEVLHVGNALNPNSPGVVGIKTSTPNKTLTVNGEISAAGNTWAAAYYGDGGNLTNLNASNISTGTLSTARLPVFNGDITTTLNSTVSTTVTKLQGNPISTSTPSNGQILQWNGTAWIPGSIVVGGSGGGGVTYYFNYANRTGISPTSGLPTSPVSASLLGREYSVGEGSLQSANLTRDVYTLVAGFVTLSSEPAVTNIPAGIWDFNIWVDIVGSSSVNQTSMQIRVYKYTSSTSTYTPLASSEDLYIYDPDVIAQYIASVTMPQTTILSSDRIYIILGSKKC